MRARVSRIRPAWRLLTSAALAVALVGGGVSGIVPAAAASVAPEWMNNRLSTDQRVERLIAAMTLDEKAALMVGDPGIHAYDNAGIPRLGIPALAMADGGAGVSPRGWSLSATGDTATAMPSGNALAATFDPAIVTKYADVVATETRATGHNVLLGPNVDIARNPWWGRVSETMSEDPFLSSALVVPYVKEVQSHDVIANLKHYNAYTQETNRAAAQNVITDERTLQEVYTPPWQAAIQKADLGSVMCSFNKIVGVYACENPELLNTILRQQLGFEGFVLSDFGAVHSTIPSVLAGTDLETGTAEFYGAPLAAAVRAGQLSESVLNESVRRILRTMFDLGLFNTDYTPTALDVEKNGQVAQTVEENAITLLKNDGGTLPLTKTVKSIAVIGGDANTVASQGGAPRVKPTYAVSPLDGIKKYVGDRVAVTYAPGTDPTSPTSMLPGPPAVPSSVLTPAAGPGAGLTAEFFSRTDFSGPILTRTEPQVTFDLGLLTSVFPGLAPSQLPPPPAGSQAVRYTGSITPPAAGEYSFALTGFGDGRAYLNDQLIIDMTGQASLRTVASGTVQLEAGRSYALRVEFAATAPLNNLDPGSVQLGWTHPAQAQAPAITAAAAAARNAEVAVVVARTHENEQRDRASLTLPNEQDQLISAVAAANPRTIVVLTTGGPVAMPWLNSVPAVLQTYFGGQEVGDALARVLAGEVNPSGKLPNTYPINDAAVPAGVTNPYATFTNPDITFGEGPLVGYQAYADQGIQPLFGFGHGLSYTTFGYDKLKIKDLKLRPKGQGVPETATVRVQVENTGSKAGAEVVQVYVGRLPTDLKTAPKRLAGFSKIDLKPGQRKTLQIEISKQALSYWDVNADQWVTPTGSVPVYVGSSSQDIRLQGTIKVS